MSSISRRNFAALCATAAGSVGLGAQTPVADEGLKSELLIDLALDTQPANNVGSSGVNRVIVPVSGGTFEGPRLKGKVLPPGGDWLQTVAGNVRLLDVRALLMTDDDQRIYMTYKGVMYTPQGGSLYWRITPYFETGSEKYAWLNSIVCVGVGYSVPTKVPYRIFQIL